MIRTICGQCRLPVFEKDQATNAFEVDRSFFFGVVKRVQFICAKAVVWPDLEQWIHTSAIQEKQILADG